MSHLERRAYTGSCHCGHVKYIVYLSLPILPYPKTTSTQFQKKSGHRIYKCNCTICHKAGIFHIRLVDPVNDFFAIAPKDPFAEGSGFKAYVPAGHKGSWHFCETCGTRAFCVRGTGYNDQVYIPTALLQRVNSRMLDGTYGEITAKEGEMTEVQVWRPKKDWKEWDDEDGIGSDYLSVNAVTLDAHNDNLSLSQLHENGYVGYVQTLQCQGTGMQEKPFFGGTY